MSAAIEPVIRGEANWVSFAVSGNRLVRENSGQLGLGELVASLPQDAVRFAYVRLDFRYEVVHLVKFIGILWQPEAVSPMTRAKAMRIKVDLQQNDWRAVHSFRQVSEAGELAPRLISAVLNLEGSFDNDDLNTFGRLNVVRTERIPDAPAVPATPVRLTTGGRAGAAAAGARTVTPSAPQLPAVETVQARVNELRAKHDRQVHSLFFSEQSAVQISLLYPSGQDATVRTAVDVMLLTSTTMEDLARLLLFTGKTMTPPVVALSWEDIRDLTQRMSIQARIEERGVHVPEALVTELTWSSALHELKRPHVPIDGSPVTSRHIRTITATLLNSRTLEIVLSN